MRSPEYILGALDVLVKSGEVSPAYAAGVADVLVKNAGLFWNSMGNDYMTEYNKFRAAHPERVKPNGTLDLTPDEATAMFDRSRNWYNSIGPDGGWGNWIKNRWKKNVSRHMWWNDDPGAEYYDREYNDMKNQRRLELMQSSNLALHPEVAGAIQDAHVRDANFRYQDARAFMDPGQMEAAGIDEDYAEKYRTAAGNSAVNGGAYKAKYDTKPKGPPKPRYGEGLPDTYGGNKKLFYRTGYGRGFGDDNAV